MSSDEIPRTKHSSTCYFWSKTGRCNKSDQECRYRHAYTGEVAPPPGTQSHQHEHAGTPDSIPEDKEITCYYWYQNGFCQFSDRDCAYAHWYTGNVASAPGGGRPRTSTGGHVHPGHMASAVSADPRLGTSRELAIEQRANPFDQDQQKQQVGEGKLSFFPTRLLI